MCVEVGRKHWVVRSKSYYSVAGHAVSETNSRIIRQK